MSAIDYTCLDDNERLGLLQLLYSDIKKKIDNGVALARDYEQKEIIVAETQKVYNRIKQRNN